MLQSFSHQQPSPRFRSQQPYRYQGNNSFSRNDSYGNRNYSPEKKSVVRNTTSTLNLILNFATITIDLTIERDAVNSIAHGNKIWFQKKGRFGSFGRRCSSFFFLHCPLFLEGCGGSSSRLSRHTSRSSITSIISLGRSPKRFHPRSSM